MAERAQSLLDSEDVRRLQRLSLRTLTALSEALIGQREGNARGATGVEFAEHRRYVPGDDLRRIDWNAYGRLDELLIKVSPVETRAQLVLMLDASASMAAVDDEEPSKLGYGRRLAAMLGAIALLRADAVQAHLLSDGRARGAGTLDTPAMLGVLTQELQRLPAGTETHLAAAVADARNRGGGDLAVLISDALVPDEDLESALRELARTAHFATLLHLVDPAEAEAGALGGYRLRDRESGELMTTEVTETLRIRYAQSYAEMLARVQARCRSEAVTYIRLSIDADPLDQLLRRAHGAGLVATV